MTIRAWIAVSAAAAAIVSLIVSGGDVALARALRSVDPGLKTAAAWVTHAGDSTIYLLGSAAAAVYFRFLRRDDRGWRTAALVFAAIACSGILVNLLKFLFGRTRPGVLYDQGVALFLGPTFDSAVRSFPSGHATTVAAAAWLAALLAPRWRVPALMAALAVGASRLLVGYHFLSDVLAGFVVGWASVELSRHAFLRLGWWPGPHAIQAPAANPRAASTRADS